MIEINSFTGTREKKAITLLVTFVLSFFLIFLLAQCDTGRMSSGNTSDGANRVDNSERLVRLTAYQVFFSTVPLAFGLLYLVLFLFFKKAKEHLYFSIFLLFYSLSIFFDYQSSITGNSTLLYITLHRAVQPFFALFGLRFVYSIFCPRLPKRFWVLAAILFPPSLWAVIHPVDGYLYLRLATILIAVETFRVTVIALRQKQDGAWLVLLGFSIYYVFGMFDSLMDLVPDMAVPFKEMENPYALGTIGFLITMAIYLARRYARNHQLLLEQQQREKEQELERRLLEADNARKTSELEEARKLQLSMLPQCLTDFPGLDTCFHMTPAAEVGGDYYDFRFAEDGSLLLAVGDATGHGMKAGIMVASIKSLFRAMGDNPDIPAFFKQCTATIKQMNMGNLFMALTSMRIKGNKFSVSSAGMPPILIYRKESRRVEDITIKGPPLGGFPGFDYRREEASLMPGDTMLLMSDGYAEQFDDNDEMMGYDRAKEIFKEAAARETTAAEVIAYLCADARKWRGNHPQDDDITFVALKCLQD